MSALDTKVALPDGLRIYAIGDIHGRFDLLQTMCALVRRDLDASRSARTVEIFLGDYIDRGRHSREVVDWLIGAPPLTNERVCLKGNHEDLLLQALADPSAVEDWLYNGGRETLASYLGAAARSTRISGIAEVHAILVRVLPERHRAFFASLRSMIDFAPYLFVHAGLRPGVPFDRQDPHDLFWIRRPFLDSDADFGRIVIHGHTPTPRPDVRRNRINIDTGAVFSGCLTCLVLEGSTRRFLQTEPE